MAHDPLADTRPDSPAGQWLARAWLPVLRSDELQALGRPVRLQLLGVRLVAFRDATQHVGVIDAICPHAAGDLFWGSLEADGLRCAYHGWKFDVAGRCVEYADEPLLPGQPQVQLLAGQVREAGGLVWASFGPTGREPTLPAWTTLPAEQVRTRTDLLNDGLGTVLEDTVLRELGDALAVADDGACLRYRVGEAEHSRDVRVTAPTFVQTCDDASGLVTWQGLVPIDDRHTLAVRALYHPRRPLSDDEQPRPAQSSSVPGKAQRDALRASLGPWLDARIADTSD